MKLALLLFMLPVLCTAGLENSWQRVEIPRNFTAPASGISLTYWNPNEAVQFILKPNQQRLP